MSEGPYREAGEVVSVEERKRGLRNELYALQALNVHGRSRAEIDKINARVDEIHHILGAIRAEETRSRLEPTLPPR